MELATQITKLLFMGGLGIFLICSILTAAILLRFALSKSVALFLTIAYAVASAALISYCLVIVARLS